MTRQEHLKWAKDRALEYVKAGDTNEAFTSMLSDLGKHDELKQSQEMAATIGMALLMGGHLNSARQMTEWIEGFN